MPFVEIYKLQNDGSQIILVICRLRPEGVVCEGEDNFVKHLNEEGIRNYSRTGLEKLYPKDGPLFLEQLQYNFKSGYLNATKVQEEQS